LKTVPPKPEPPTVLPVLLPQKPPPPAGKRSGPAYTQKGVFLKKASVAEANARLDARGDKTDFSDLMQSLLEAWLAT
jgi:hypothetical protein